MAKESERAKGLCFVLAKAPLVKVTNKEEIVIETCGLEFGLEFDFKRLPRTVGFNLKQRMNRS